VGCAVAAVDVGLILQEDAGVELAFRGIGRDRCKDARLKEVQELWER
jgi:hypothetical protein